MADELVDEDAAAAAAAAACAAISANNAWLNSAGIGNGIDDSLELLDDDDVDGSLPWANACIAAKSGGKPPRFKLSISFRRSFSALSYKSFDEL